MKRCACVLLTVLLLLSYLTLFSSAHYNQEIKDEMLTKSYMLISLDEGTQTMFQSGVNKKLAPAAFVKIISILTVLEKCQDIDKIITVKKKALAQGGYYDTASCDLEAGEKISIRYLLYCLMMESANDAADVLAYEIGNGDPDSFVAMMNEIVQKIGCKNTVLKNCTGIDAKGQYTTVSDMVEILKYGLAIPVFQEIFTSFSVTIPKTNKNDERTYTTGNKMGYSTSEYYNEYTTGGKSGGTEKAGRVFAVTANKDGYSYLAVVMNGKYKEMNGVDYDTSVLDAKTMLEWVFDNIRYQTVAKTTQVIAVLNVNAGKNSDTVSLVPANDVSVLVPVGVDYDSVLIQPVEGSLPERMTAPVKKGEVLGKASIYYATQEIAKVDLVANETVKRSSIRFIGMIAGKVFGSIFFKVILILAVLAVVGYGILMFIANYKEKKSTAHHT